MRKRLLMVVVLIGAGLMCQSAIAGLHGFRGVHVYGYYPYGVRPCRAARAYYDSLFYPHPQHYGRWDLYFGMHGSPWRF